MIYDSGSQDRRKNTVCALHLAASEFTKAHYIGLEGASEPCFLWVTEFPLFTRADSDKEFLARGRWSSSHHPFTAPMCEDVGNLIRGDFSLVRCFLFSMFRHGKLAKKVRGQHYDLVLNGMEIGGGSVRIHDAAMQEFVFKEVLQVRPDSHLPK